MKIDKRTGRGCALSIASKTVARRLVDDGIVGKVIARKFLKYRCDSIRIAGFGTGLEDIYVVLRKGVGEAEQPLWTPTFIDPAIWPQAASHSRPGEKLAESVERNLLPEMDSYLQSLSDSALVSMVREFLLEHSVINKPIRQCRGNTYYFTEDEVYTQDAESTLFPYEKRLRFNLFGVSNETCFNSAVWTKATTHFKPGMSLMECIGVFLETKISVHRTRSPRMKFCVQRGLGELPSTSRAEGKITAGFFPLRAECINTGIACTFLFRKFRASHTPRTEKWFLLPQTGRRPGGPLPRPGWS